jgi:hypothetical protein
MSAVVVERLQPGFYMFTRSTKERHFLGTDFSSASLSLQRVGDRVLNDANEYKYWVEEYVGLDVFGNEYWANHEVQEDLLDFLEKRDRDMGY